MNRNTLFQIASVAFISTLSINGSAQGNTTCSTPLIATGPNKQSEQWFSSGSAATQIKLYVDLTFSSSEVASINAAAADWNANQSKLNFTVTAADPKAASSTNLVVAITSETEMTDQGLAVEFSNYSYENLGGTTVVRKIGSQITVHRNFKSNATDNDL